MPSGNSFYEEEEAEQILRIAVSQQAGLGKVSRENLVATASELGISPEALAQAEEQWASQRSRNLEYQQFERDQRKVYWTHLLSFILVNAFLLAINLITSSQTLWFIYPLLGWGLGLAFHTASTFLKGTGMHDEAYEEWRAEKARARRGQTSDETILRQGRRITVGVHVNPSAPASVRQQLGPVNSQNANTGDQPPSPG